MITLTVVTMAVLWLEIVVFQYHGTSTLQVVVVQASKGTTALKVGFCRNFKPPPNVGRQQGSVCSTDKVSVQSFLCGCDDTTEAIAPSVAKGVATVVTSWVPAPDLQGVP